MDITILCGQIDIPDQCNLYISDYDCVTKPDSEGIFLHFGPPVNPNLTIFLSDLVRNRLVMEILENAPRLKECDLEMFIQEAKDRLENVRAENKQRARSLDPGPLPL